MNHQTRGNGRWAPLAGIAAVALLAASVAVVEGGPGTPSADTPPPAVLSYLEAERDRLLGASYVAGLGVLLLLVFAASLRAALRGRGRRSDLAADVALAGTVAAAVLLCAAVAPIRSAALVLQDDGQALGPEAAQAMYHAGDGLFPAAFTALALTVAATAVAALGGAPLPRWFGWVSIVAAAGLALPVIQWAAAVFAFPIWLIACSLLLARAPAASRPAPEPLPA